ncbi:hypothetical protein FDUTEX481_00216 [Tolypothrix sp. PCC 7601]|nr:hypothetical protein [Tolypothrix sp. PCC 7601]EKF06052.1 hypothetical protein FDUTEX481_00216 [Tolypothrix sp. PCC 7601]UYD29730.1 hypothetical protein HGR01_17930 [Tolypothrix sp. PCC 7712]BAY89109.1 hypothetical protein NIES3275_11120 [Microchaete diplosiphon NIES-3275]
MLGGSLASGLVAFLDDGHSAFTEGVDKVIAMSGVMAIFAIASYAAYTILAPPAERRLALHKSRDFQIK